MIGAGEIFSVLNSFGVEYVVIGGIAQTLRGVVIRTDDVDICPSRSPENLRRLTRALAEMDAREWDAYKGEEVDRDWSVEMLEVDNLWILRTKHGALDVLLKPAGSDGYDSLSEDADIMEVGGLEVPVVSVDALIEMKEAAGRAKDREHLSFLYRLRRMTSRGDMLDFEGTGSDALEDLRPTQQPDQF